MENNKYNGWSNYATWRINLEIVDSTNWVKEDFVPDEQQLTVSDLSEHIKSVCENIITGFGELDNNPSAEYALSYAQAFLEQVNWYEIAEHMAENYPDWNVIKN